MGIHSINTTTWYECLASLTAELGSECFAEQLTATCRQISPYEGVLITGFAKKQRPQPIFSNLSEVQLADSLDPYLAGSYLLDPFYDLYRKNALPGIYRLREIMPDGFYDSEYYRSYYTATQLRHEAGLLITVDDAFTVLVSLGIRDPENSVSLGEWQTLTTVAPLLLELCKRHWNLAPLGSDRDEHLLGESLETAFANFGREHLSEREREVVHSILRGHSSKSIARLLAISPETVKQHRKSLHAKLGISSQAELFSLFLESIAMVPIGGSEDPLSLYFHEHPNENI